MDDNNNINEQILKELRLHTHLYRKRYIPIFVIFIAFLAFSGIFKYYSTRSITHKPNQVESLTWNYVEDLCDQGDYKEAEKQALIIVKRNAGDYYSHACIARIYLRKGDLPQALKHAEIAYRLFPNKDNEETLGALNKLLASRPQKTSEVK